MRHNHSAEFGSVKIRPVTEADAPFIHSLRLDKELAKFIGNTNAALESQLKWLENYFARPDDYYFLIEVRGQPVGTIGLYSFREDGRSAEWGRWVIKQGCMAAPASALLIYSFAFDHLKLDHVFCRTVSANLPVLSIHDRSGAKRSHVEENAVEIAGAMYDFVVHEVPVSEWPQVRSSLSRFAEMAERFL